MRLASRRTHATSLVLFCTLFIFVTSFWGRIGLLLPPPFDNWQYVFVRSLMRWSDGARQALSSENNLTIYAGVEAFVLGLLVPASALLLIFKRTLADLGLRGLDSRTCGWTIAASLLAVPVGMGTTAIVPVHTTAFVYFVRTLGMIPEHFLICCVVLGLLLPARKLEYPPEKHGTLAAISGSAVIFIAAHVGAPPVEVILSAPLGVIFAYMTWRSASIWPAIATHWALNLGPLGLRAAFG